MSRFATALVHDYLTQRGGAERVVLSLERAFPGSPVFTSLFEPDLTFPEFKQLDIRTNTAQSVRPPSATPSTCPAPACDNILALEHPS